MSVLVSRDGHTRWCSGLRRIHSVLEGASGGGGNIPRWRTGLHLAALLARPNTCHCHWHWRAAWHVNSIEEQLRQHQVSVRMPMVFVVFQVMICLSLTNTQPMRSTTLKSCRKTPWSKARKWFIHRTLNSQLSTKTFSLKIWRFSAKTGTWLWHRVEGWQLCGLGFKLISRHSGGTDEMENLFSQVWFWDWRKCRSYTSSAFDHTPCEQNVGVW